MKTVLVVSFFLSLSAVAQQSITASQAYQWVMSQAFTKQAQSELLKYGAQYGTSGEIRFVRLEGVTPEKQKCVVNFYFGNTKGSEIPFVAVKIQRLTSQGVIHIVSANRASEKYAIGTTERNLRPSFKDWVITQKTEKEEKGIIVKEFTQTKSMVFMLKMGATAKDLFHCSAELK